MSEIVDLAEALDELFPVGSELVQLHVVPAHDPSWRRSDEPAAYATFRTIVWERDPDTGERRVRDIKEQDIYMGWPKLYDERERVAAWAQALERVLSEIPMDKLETLMPADLVHPKVLELRKAQSVEDFDKALRAKKRLGQWLR